MSLIGSTRDYAIWFDLFFPSLHGDSTKAERVAKLFHSLIVDIENNPEGALCAIECLETALAVAFSFTPMYRTCHILFQASLGSDFPTGLDSMEQVAEAMRRVSAAIKRAETRRRTRRKQIRKRSRSQ